MRKGLKSIYKLMGIQRHCDHMLAAFMGQARSAPVQNFPQLKKKRSRRRGRRGGKNHRPQQMVAIPVVAEPSEVSRAHMGAVQAPFPVEALVSRPQKRRGRRGGRRHKRTPVDIVDQTMVEVDPAMVELMLQQVQSSQRLRGFEPLHRRES